MARAATTSDVFNAIAEPRRRQIIELLARGEQDVGELVHQMRIPQPAVSKHLRVLRTVRLVSVNRRGRRKVYRVNAQELKPVHDWVKNFERFWTQQLLRIKDRAEQTAREQKTRQSETSAEPKP
jgi:DNA-binding transcriptional ArsR family regulator